MGVISAHKDSFSIIGSGAAGVSAALSFRKYNQDMDIDIFTRERVYPYYKPKLSEYLIGKIGIKDIYLYSPEYYKENNINFYFGETIKTIIPDINAMSSKSLNRYYYTKLLIATGSITKDFQFMGKDKEGIFTFTDYYDAKKIKEYLPYAKTVGILGGGLLGVELGIRLANSGKQVYIIELFNRLLPKHLDVKSSEILAKHLSHKGLSIITYSTVREVFGNSGRISEIILNTGARIKAEMFILCNGSEPQLEMVSDHFRCTKGLPVNSGMNTINHNIFAAGDIIELNNKVFGNWIPALVQGEVAGASATERPSQFQDFMLEYKLNALDIKLMSIGNIDSESKLENKVKADPDNYSYRKIVLDNNYVTGAVLLGDTANGTIIKDAVKNRKKFDEIESYF